jgi:hypothetical protein
MEGWRIDDHEGAKTAAGAASGSGELVVEKHVREAVNRGALRGLGGAGFLAQDPQKREARRYIVEAYAIDAPRFGLPWSRSGVICL